MRLGEYDMRYETECDYLYNDQGDCNLPPQDILIEKNIMHASYKNDDPMKQYDIGLMRLKDDAKITGKVTIC